MLMIMAVPIRLYFEQARYVSHIKIRSDSPRKRIPLYKTDLGADGVTASGKDPSSCRRGEEENIMCIFCQMC
jgi:hypothetical protein